MSQIENFLGLALLLVIGGWYSHRRAVRRAERNGDEVPGGWDLAWSLFKPLAALGIACTAAFIYLRAARTAGHGVDGLIYFLGIYVVAFVVYVLAFGVLTLLAAAGRPMQLLLGVASVGVVVFGMVLPFRAIRAGHGPQVQAQAPVAPQAPRTGRRKLDIPAEPNGVAPRQLQVEPDGESLRVTNGAEQALLVSIARALPRARGGYDRCPLGVERKSGIDIHPEVGFRETVTFVSSCDPRFANAPLEYQVAIVNGKTIFMSESAFSP